MSRTEGLVERAIKRLAGGLSARGVAAAVLILYPGVGLLLPLALGWSIVPLIEVNLLAITIAAVLALMWFSLQIEARDRRHLLDWTTNLRLLNAEEFEWFVGELFRREGWRVRETGRQDAADGYVDLELTRDGQRLLAQCKRWTSRLVGVDEVRQLAGVLLREGLPGSAGVLVTLSTFSTQAEAEATRIGLQLIDGRELQHRTEAARRAEPCPVCGRAMRFDRSPRGWWFRCVSDGCSGKRDLGHEARAAVDFLSR